MENDFKGEISRGSIILLVLVSLILAVTVGGAVMILETTQDDEEVDLVIYAYDSFQSYGLGPAVIPKFEALHDVNIEVQTPGDVGTVLSKMQMEKANPNADIVIGVDNSLLHKAVDLGLLEPYIPENIDRLDPTMAFDPDHYVVPFDYGYIAIICNGTLMTERQIPIPGSIMDLADPVYDGQILLLDPAQSSTGSSFMIWAASVAGNDTDDFFSDLADNANGKVMGSWDSMYELWSHGEAPIAISYGLDTAYEMMWYGTNNTITVVPENEGYRQIEGAGLVKGAKNEDLAKKFLDFILTDDFQEEVYNNYMLPVVPSVEIDPLFLEFGVRAEEHVEPSVDFLRADPDDDGMSNFDEWESSWRNAFFG